MFFINKKANSIKIETFKLSENAVLFIEQYAKPQLGITEPIDADGLYRIIELATEWEEDMIDPQSEDGCDKAYDYAERERNEAADNFVGEITGKWDDDKFVPDFDDLNERLGLK